MEGFHVDLANAVAAAADMNARVVSGPAVGCFDSTQFLGVGLQDKWYDGCVGWFQTGVRIHMYFGSFSSNTALARNGLKEKMQ